MTLFDEPRAKGLEITLRPYQIEAKAAVHAARDRGLRRVVVVMPTGCGKTTVFASLIQDWPDERGIVIAHRDELLTQAHDRIAGMNPGVHVAVEGGVRSADPLANVVVAGIQSIGRSDTKRLPGFTPTWMIIDECHHAAASTYQNAMQRFGSYDDKCFTLGVTATDHRMDNKRLHGDHAVFEDVVYRLTLKEAIQDGWLCGLRGFRVATDIDLSRVKTTAGDYNLSQLAEAVNTDARNTAALRHWHEVASRRRTIVFCVDVAHAKEVARLFQEMGVSAESVDAALSQDERRARMARFRSGETQVLANVELVTEGVDVPEIECVLLLRPTKSWALFTQMVGRGLRLSDGKHDCLVLDVVDLTRDHNLNDRPGVAGLVGLPPQMDLEGKDVMEAVDLYESMGGGTKARLFQRQFSFSDLKTGIQEIDLLAELAIPEEITGYSRLAWLKVSDGKYVLSCGSSKLGDEVNRYAEVRIDELGRPHASLTSSSRQPLTAPYPDLRTAFLCVEDHVRRLWPDCGGIVSAKAAWRDRPPSEGQLRFMKRLGVPDDVLSQVQTMGQASMLIEKFKRSPR